MSFMIFRMLRSYTRKRTYVRTTTLRYDESCTYRSQFAFEIRSLWCSVVGKNGTQIVYPANSSIVLARLNNTPTTWNTLLADRVTSISDAVATTIWRNDNPGNVVSRGCNADGLKDNKL